MSSTPRRLRSVPGAADRLDRSSALVAGLPDTFAGTVFDPADHFLAGAFSARSVLVL